MGKIIGSGIAGLFLVFSLLGCPSQKATQSIELRQPAEYAKELSNEEFKWNGPVSREDRIPISHAARALAYLGDPSVPYLFDSVANTDVSILSIYDALSEIGLPVEDYREEIVTNRKITGISKWWDEHRFTSLRARSHWRQGIGLPPIEVD